MVKLHTMFFTFAVVVYAGVTAAVSFAASPNFAFGWVLSQLFIWAAWVAFVCWVITRIGLRREKEWWEARMEGEGAFTPRETKERIVEKRGDMEDGIERDVDVKEKRDPQTSGAAGRDQDDQDPYLDEKKMPYGPDG